MTSEEYYCHHCGHRFPSLQGREQKGLRCPRCGSPRVERERWLLGTPEGVGLAPEDYFSATMKV